MIQFNLLPTVKLQHVRTQRNKRIAILIASLTTIGAVVVMVFLLLIVQVFQRNYLNDLNKDIKAQTTTLQNTPDLNKILTIQNQLNSLPPLHDQKQVTSRLFTYVKQVTPAQVSIASLSFDFDGHVISLTGSADSIGTINKFVDTLKFTTYKTADNKEGNAFSKVVLSSFGKDDKGASYQISLNFEPVIFEGTNEVTLVVPNKITTRSETEKPEALFQPLTNQQEGQ